MPNWDLFEGTERNPKLEEGVDCAGGGGGGDGGGGGGTDGELAVVREEKRAVFQINSAPKVRTRYLRMWKVSIERTANSIKRNIRKGKNFSEEKRKFSKPRHKPDTPNGDLAYSRRLLLEV